MNAHQVSVGSTYVVEKDFYRVRGQSFVRRTMDYQSIFQSVMFSFSSER